MICEFSPTRTREGAFAPVAPDFPVDTACTAKSMAVLFIRPFAKNDSFAMTGDGMLQVCMKGMSMYPIATSNNIRQIETASVPRVTPLR